MLQAIERRSAPMGSPNVIVDQSDVAAGDLKRGGAVTEDPLEREYVAAVG